MTIILNYPAGSSVITKVLKMRRRGQQGDATMKEWSKYATLLATKMNKGAENLESYQKLKKGK